MKFRTEFTTQKSILSLDPALPVVLAGSCFSQNIALKMNQHGWKAILPFGTLYNPLSIATAIDIMIDQTHGLDRFRDSLFLFNGIWNSWWFDSSISSLNHEDSIEEFALRQKDFLNNLQIGNTLIITFGTSICYFLHESDSIVGNCHKMPAGLFYRNRISVSQIVDSWIRIINRMQLLFPELKIIFTVSPVRHLKDGFTANARSKAILLLAIEEIISHFPEHCFYFPAFEIINDDLRDYRFYASDLIHPSDEAIDYVWQKFLDSFIEPAGYRLLQEGLARWKAENHRPKTGALGKNLEKGSHP